MYYGAVTCYVRAFVIIVAEQYTPNLFNLNK